MGYYVNPPNGESKERWLADHGFEVGDFYAWDERPAMALPVCLVDNGLFTAAGVAFDAREQEAFTLPNDLRPKRYFYVHVDDLMKIEALPADFKVFKVGT